jgi:hypothetical protein
LVKSSNVLIAKLTAIVCVDKDSNKKLLADLLVVERLSRLVNYLVRIYDSESLF